MLNTSLHARMLDVEGIPGEVHYAPFDPQQLPETSGVYMVFHEQDCLYVSRPSPTI
jgi:hypothetical protein